MAQWEMKSAWCFFLIVRVKMTGLNTELRERNVRQEKTYIYPTLEMTYSWLYSVDTRLIFYFFFTLDH